MRKYAVDLTGKRFGKLTAIKRLPNINKNGARWLCKCDCGNEKIAYAGHLNTGCVKSCGCSSTRRKDLTGQRFGRLVVIKYDCTKNTKLRWLCKCDCGNIKSISGSSLSNGTISCGCKTLEINTKHGMAGTPEYDAWRHMFQRCYNEHTEAYQNYGGRGIKVCKEWNSLSNFLKDMGPRPHGMSIDRIDVDGNYCPENCRWADKSTQANNKTNNVFIEFNGLSLSLAQWGKLLDVNSSTISRRLNKGWSVEKVLFKNGNTIPIVERVPIAK